MGSQVHLDCPRRSLTLGRLCRDPNREHSHSSALGRESAALPGGKYPYTQHPHPSFSSRHAPQDYIPVGSLDEGSLKLPEEGPSLKVLGFVAASSVPRHIFMDETYVVVAEPESAQSAGAVSSLVRAMKNLNQV